MEKLALIGLGRIAKNYTDGIARSLRFALVAICDLDENAPSRAEYGEVPFYTDYKTLIERERPDWLLIATPPTTHVPLAEYALTHGVSVLLEKPATLSLPDYHALSALAAREGKELDVMLHWQWGNEIPFLSATLFAERPERIEIEIHDPYSADGLSIDANRRALMGAWFDSGINALSMLDALVDISQYRIVSAKAVPCATTGLPIFVRVELDVGGIAVSLTVDWRLHDDAKRSRIVAGGREYLTDHMARTVTVDGEEQCFATDTRLVEHYRNFFEGAYSAGTGEAALPIHEILFKAGELF